MVDAIFFLPAAALTEAAADEDIKTFISSRRYHEPVNFRHDPFQRQSPYTVVCRRHSTQQLFYRQEIKLSRKPAGPEQAQGIFTEPAPRVAYGNQTFLTDIFLTTCIIINMVFVIHSQGIDGKIAAHHIFTKRGSVPDCFWPVTVRSIPFSPECSRLDSQSIDDQDDDAKGFSVDFYGVPVFFFCYDTDFLRPRRCRHIIVMRLPLHQQVPHSPAYDIRFKTVITKSTQNAPYNWIQQLHPISYNSRIPVHFPAYNSVIYYQNT